MACVVGGAFFSTFSCWCRCTGCQQYLDVHAWAKPRQSARVDRAKAHARSHLIGSLKRIDVDVLGLSHLAVVGQVDDAVDLAQDLHEGERALSSHEGECVCVVKKETHNKP